MDKQKSLSGVYSPVVTPFNAALEPDTERLVKHCKWLLGQDVGLAIFGTNSEANSMSVSEKVEVFDALLDAGIPAERLLPGTGCCALSDTVALTRHAVKHGAPSVLMLPPFFYKGVSEEGLFASFSDVIERTGDDELRLYLYHIPQMSQIDITLSLIERLLKAYPGTVAGIKDSSGDWNHTKAMINEFGSHGFKVFAGSEKPLLATLKAGGAGCITATGNVNPAPIVNLYSTWQQQGAEKKQSALNKVRDCFSEYPIIPSMKTAISFFADDPGWERVRPPLVALTELQKNKLVSRLQENGFIMPNMLG